jgi:hypothetical protein
MNKKYLTIGIIVAVAIAFILFYFNFGVQCFDGQGFTLYIPKDTLMNNLANADTSQIRGNWIPETIFTYTAKTATNSCGKIITRVIIENDKETKASQKNFDKFVADYNTQCSNCLFKVYQSGNSPLFVKEISSGKSFMVENINGTLTLKELFEGV